MSKTVAKERPSERARIVARSLGMSHIITIDADGQHDPADLPLFLDAIAKDDNAIIVGARDFNTANVPGSSRFGRKFSNFWLRVQTGIAISDVQSGFRAYRWPFLKAAVY
jgi:Glycosyl transferase family 2.